MVPWVTMLSDLSQMTLWLLQHGTETTPLPFIKNFSVR